LRSRRQGHPHEARTLLRRTWVYNLRSKRPALRFTDSTASNLDPFIVRGLVHDVGDEDPVLTTFFGTVHDDFVASAHTVPAGASHHMTVTSDDGAAFHASFLLVAHVVT
jgi:hypothetical protein